MATRNRRFSCPNCGSRNIKVGTAFNFSTYLPEELRGVAKRKRRDCHCRTCKHKWESTHPVAMQSPEPTDSPWYEARDSP